MAKSNDPCDHGDADGENSIRDRRADEKARTTAGEFMAREAGIVAVTAVSLASVAQPVTLTLLENRDGSLMITRHENRLGWKVRTE